MRHLLLAAAAALTLLPTANASAAEILGATDVSAGPATVACATGCTAVQMEPAAGTPVVQATADGVLVSVTWRHGDWTDPPGEIAIDTSVDVRVVSGSSSKAVSMGQLVRHGDLTSAFSLRGVAVKAGDRVGLGIGRGGIPLFRPGSGGAAGAYHEGTSSYAPIAGELLVQARIEADADGDGLGDETQDPSPPKPAPGPQPQPGPLPSLPSDFSGIDEFRAEPVVAFQAKPVDFFKARTIKRLPATTSMYDAVMKGFSTPVRCPRACAYLAYSTIFAIGDTLAGNFRQKPRPLVVGTAIGELPGPGQARARLRFDPGVRKALLKVRKRVRVKVAYLLADETGVTIRRQTITLKPRKRG